MVGKNKFKEIKHRPRWKIARRKFEVRRCEKCNQTYKPNASNQRFCGGYSGKSGCSYKERQRRKFLREKRRSQIMQKVMKDKRVMKLVKKLFSEYKEIE